MSSIHFTLNEAQEQELALLMSREGITSRAGFFRFLMKFYKYHQSPQMTTVAQIPSQTTTTTGTPTTISENHEIDDSNLSPEKQKLLNDPRIFDEEVKQFIREMEE